GRRGAHSPPEGGRPTSVGIPAPGLRTRGGRRLRYPAPMRQLLGAIGRVLVTVGILLLLFVAYQLWGTGIYEARAQSRLQDQFEQQQRRHAHATATARRPPARRAPRPRRRRRLRRSRRRRRRHPCSSPRTETRSRTSRSRRSGSTRTSWRASMSRTYARDPATTPAPRSPGRKATQRSQVTAPPTERRSATSTSSHRATRWSWRRCRERSSTAWTAIRSQSIRT